MPSAFLPPPHTNPVTEWPPEKKKKPTIKQNNKIKPLIKLVRQPRIWDDAGWGGEKASTLNMIRHLFARQSYSISTAYQSYQCSSAVRCACEVGQGRGGGGGVTSQRSRDRMPSRPGTADTATSHLTSLPASASTLPKQLYWLTRHVNRLSGE